MDITTLARRVLIAACACLLPTTTMAQVREHDIVVTSATVMDEIMAVHLRGIPEAMLEDAEGIAIIPNVIKASFAVGGRHGKGVLLIRDEQSNWQLPVFVSLTGGNFGWQIGIQSTDLILVFKTRKSVRGILDGKLTLGADLAVAAGPVGREAAVATDHKLKAEIYSYSRSRGLFAGASIDGSVLRVEPGMNASYYAWRQSAIIPPEQDAALLLVTKVAAYCDQGRVAMVAAPQQLLAEVPTSPAASLQPAPLPIRAEEALRAHLTQADGVLRPLLDPTWNAFLALPAEIYQGGAHPSVNALRQTLGRFERVAQDPNYRLLTARPEFRAVWDLLKEYERALSHQEAVLPLPAPPPASSGHLP